MHIGILLSLCLVIFQTVVMQPALAKQTKLNIAMLVWRGETDAEHGFRQRIASLGYDAQFDIFNAQQDKARLGTLLRQKINFNKYDYIYTFGTTVSLQTKAYLKGKVPHIFNIVADPVGAGLVSSLAGSGGNLCGVKSGVPLRLQIENAHQILGFKRLGYIFNPRERNSNVTLESLSTIARKFGFQVITFRSPPVQDRLSANLAKIMDGSAGVDAVYLPSDSFVVSNAKKIAASLKQSGVASVGAIKKYISEGALMGSVADYGELGSLAAMIVDLHQNGRKLEDIPIQTPATPHLIVNQKSMEALNLDLPDSVLKSAMLISR